MGIVGQSIAKLPVVTNSVDFRRIEAIPRRVLDLSSVTDVSPLFCKPDTPLRYWPIQSAALVEASQQNGLFAPVKVGGGKTLICLSLPEALNSQRAVLLVKPQLRDQLRQEIGSFYTKHFELPIDRITVVAYSELSAQSGAFVLDEINPDLIIADEAHCLRHRSAARTKRFLRYMKEHPACRFCALSGTMTNRSILEYAHLLALSHQKNSPLPTNWNELRDWSGALDVNPEQSVQPGRLRVFCQGDETPRQGYRRRLVETEAVVATGEDDLGVGLVIQRLDFDHPMGDVIDEVKARWEYDDQVFTEALELHRFLRQVALGFYYKWDWPDGVVDHEWLEARKNWAKEVRERLKTAKPGMDSPGLIENAAERGDFKSANYAAWRLVKDRPVPPTSAVWINRYIFGPVFSWIRSIGEEKRGIIWYEHQAVGDFLAKACNLPLYDPSKDPRDATERVILASRSAHGDGKNLQVFSRQLFTSLPSNGTTVEQAIGRSHRPGQLDDTVEVSWFGHTDSMIEAFDKAMQDAHYVEETTGQRYSLLYASKISKKF